MFDEKIYMTFQLKKIGYLFFDQKMSMREIQQMKKLGKVNLHSMLGFYIRGQSNVNIIWASAGSKIIFMYINTQYVPRVIIFI